MPFVFLISPVNATYSNLPEPDVSTGLCSGFTSSGYFQLWANGLEIDYCDDITSRITYSDAGLYNPASIINWEVKSSGAVYKSGSFAVNSNTSKLKIQKINTGFYDRSEGMNFLNVE